MTWREQNGVSKPMAIPWERVVRINNSTIDSFEASVIVDALH
jgi:hypothetical protein